MAAAEAATRTYPRDVLGVACLTVGVAGARRVAVQSEGLIAIEYFLEFDKAGIKILCESVCKPSGKFLMLTIHLS